ncbi:MAG: nitroreductase [Actinomycetota bacterium]
MDVREAVYARRSIREFGPDPVADDVVRELLIDASRAPSGGNMQPWRIDVVNGSAMTRLREYLPTQPQMEEPEYDVYPPSLWEPHRTLRYQNAEQLYGLIGVPRDDKAGRRAQFARNDDFFGAPTVIFCFVDRGLGKPQWSDLGMFLQTFMLLATERGLATCAQEYWALRHGAIHSFVGAPADEMLFCAVCLGTPDPRAIINTLYTPRMPLEDWTRWVQ